MKVVQKITTHLLFFVMVFGLMKNNLLYVIYEYDTGLFVSMFCENTGRPQMHCNGKCKLEKMGQEEQKEEAAKVLKELQTEALICCPARPQDLVKKRSLLVISDMGYNSRYRDLYSFLYITKSVKPPDAAA